MRSSNEDRSVELAGIHFSNQEDLGTWIKAKMSPIVPYGCFMNVYSFLNRLLYAQSNGTGLVGIMPNSKLSLRTDNAVTVEFLQENSPISLTAALL